MSWHFSIVIVDYPHYLTTLSDCTKYSSIILYAGTSVADQPPLSAQIFYYIMYQLTRILVLFFETRRLVFHRRTAREKFLTHTRI